MNSLKMDPKALENARRQFCLDVCLPWEEYMRQPRQKIYIKKATYKKGTLKVLSEGARDYERGSDFFHAIICLGQLFLVVDEQIYDWAVEKFADCDPEWFCEFGNLRMIDEKLREYGHEIKDTHIYMLPETKDATEGGAAQEGQTLTTRLLSKTDENFIWYDQEEILRFQQDNQFTSAICFSKTQPDMLAVAAMKDDGGEDSQIHQTSEKSFDQSLMKGMAGVSADGAYLWQIGINVIPSVEGQGLAAKLVRMMKEEVLRRGKIPFYGTSESHNISKLVGLKAGFVPAWTEVYAK